MPCIMSLTVQKTLMYITTLHMCVSYIYQHMYIYDTHQKWCLTCFTHSLGSCICLLVLGRSRWRLQKQSLCGDIQHQMTPKKAHKPTKIMKKCQLKCHNKLSTKRICLAGENIQKIQRG